MKESIAIVAALLALVGNLPYLHDILTKRVQPHAYTWLVWSLVTAITLSGQVVKGAGWGALPTAVSEIFTVLIFLLSLKYGFKKASRSDTFFLIFALLGLIPWVLTKDPTISVVIVVTIDLIAFIPTLRKGRYYPKTDVKLLYSMNVLRHVLALFSLQSYNIATMLHSLAMIVANSLMTLILLKNTKKDKKLT